MRLLRSWGVTHTRMDFTDSPPFVVQSWFTLRRAFQQHANCYIYSVMTTTNTAPAAGAPLLRMPVAADGSALNSLVSRCPPLDPNSVYCNLLQCTHFAGTSVAADAEGTLAGFISGYLVPMSSDTLFVWQVAVAPEFRGQGLATRMLHELLARPACKQVRYVETTVTDANIASLSLFNAFANRRKARLTSTPYFDKTLHFDGRHDSERLLRIGPLT